MALTTFSGVVSPSVLNSNFDDKTASLTTNAKAGQKDWQVNVEKETLSTADDVSLRSVEIVPQDDFEVRVLGLSVYDAGASLVATLTLTSPDDDDYLLERSLTVSATTAAGSHVHARTDLRTSTGDRVFLLRGVRYRLTLDESTAGAIGRAYGFVLLRARRRRT